MARNSVAIRLGVEGGAEVKREFQSVGDAGEQAAQRLGRQFEQQSAAAERAAQRAARTARTLADMQTVTPMQARINDVTGVDRNMGNAGAARASAAAFMDLEQRSQRLLASIDPLYAAQARLNAEMAEARALHAAGAITTDQLAQAQGRLQQQYLQTATASRAANDNNGLLRAGYQQLGFQISDVGAMLAAGASPAIVFATQASQILQALNMIGEGKAQGAAGGADEALGGLSETLDQATGNFETMKGATEQATELLGGFAGAEDKAGEASDKKKTKMQALMGFMGGPWGAVLIGGVSLLAMFAGGLFEAEESVESLTEAMIDNADKAELQRLAAEAYAQTLPGQIDAIRKLIAANADLGRSEEDRRAATLQRLAGFGEESARVRELIEERVELAQFGQDLEMPSLWASMGITDGREASEQIDLVVKRLNELDASLAAVGVTLPDTGGEVDAFISQLRNLAAEADRTQRSLRFQGLVDTIAAEGDAAAQERLRHERSISALRSAVDSGDADDEARVEQLIREEQRRHDQTMQNIEARREAERDAEQASERAQRERQQHEQRRRETIEGIERETRAAWALAEAYVAQTGTVAQAEAAQRAANDARELGLDQADHQRRVFDLMVAEQVRDDMRQVLNFEMEAGDTDFTIRHLAGISDGWRRLDDEMEQNRLTTALRLVQFDKEGREIVEVTQAIDRLRSAHSALNASQRRAELVQAVGAMGADARDAAELARIGDSRTRDAAIARAGVAADREVADRRWASADWLGAAIYRGTARRNAGEAWDRETNDFFSNQIAQRERSIELLDIEASLVGRGRREREMEMRLAELRLDLADRFQGEQEGEVERLMQIARAEEERKIALERTYEAMAEFNELAGGVVDELFNLDNWDDWGAAGIRILKRLAQEMLILGAANPLKNMMDGGNRPTLDGIIGALGNLLGGGGGGGGGAFGGGRTPGFAPGTLSYPGGWALLGENGPELARLPRGSQISTAAETRRMMAGANDNRVGLVINADFRGADPGSEGRIRAQLDQLKQEIPGMALMAVQDARERSHGRF